jgi:hypothetical protein
MQRMRASRSGHSELLRPRWLALTADARRSPKPNMKKQASIIVSALLLLTYSSVYAKDKEADKKEEEPKVDVVGGQVSEKNTKDQFVGTYIRIPFIGTYGNVNPEATGKKFQITKAGEVYHLSGSNDAFVEKSKGVLEDITLGTPIVRRGSLGTITAGQMNFSDGSKPIEVLKVKFAFDHFLLIKVHDTVPLKP